MAVQQTSLLAYQEQLELGLSRRHQQVYEAVKRLGAASNNMIAQYTELPINVITPRVKELRDEEYLGFEYKDRDPITKKTVMFWSYREPEEARRLREIKEQDCEA